MVKPGWLFHQVGKEEPLTKTVWYSDYHPNGGSVSSSLNFKVAKTFPLRMFWKHENADARITLSGTFHFLISQAQCTF